MTTTTTVDRGDKQEAILAAALELFAERGFHGTAVPEVAKRAGVGAGTIYRYFDSKEALVNALYRQCKMELSQALMTDFPVGAPPRAQFEALFRRAVRFALDHPTATIFMELHHHGSYLDAQSQALSDQLRDVICAVLDPLRAQQVTKDLPSNAVIAMVMGALTGLMRDSWQGLYELDSTLLSQVEEAVWELIRR